MDTIDRDLRASLPRHESDPDANADSNTDAVHSLADHKRDADDANDAHSDKASASENDDAGKEDDEFYDAQEEADESSALPRPGPAPPSPGSQDDASSEQKDDDKKQEEEEPIDPVASAEAVRLKEVGNRQFAMGRYAEAIETYSQAIKIAPPRDRENLAIFFNNRAACHIKMGRASEAVADCSHALRHSPKYVKALMRRAQGYETMNLLQEAIDDYKTVTEIEPQNEAAQQRHKKLSEAKFEKDKEEMLGKLKELGNTILGKFGLSIDNFKAEKDPSTGSYSIKFSQ